MKNAFEVVQCLKEHKLTFVAHLLQGVAKHWWNGAKAHLRTMGTPLDLKYFESTLLDKYYPKSARRKNELEFVHLQQGDMSVAEYVTKFEQQGRFSSHAHYELNEELKINQFECGLKQEIRGNI